MASENNSFEQDDRLFLADAMALAYRAHYAFINRPLVNSKGLNTSAIYGFTQSLLRLLERENPEHIAVVFDSDEEPTFRDEMYEEYKANRPPMPDDLQEALPYIKDVVRAFDIPLLEVPGVEADDVIGTLAREAEDEVEVVIFSPDKDFRQLLSPHISILRPAYRGEEFELMTEEKFRERYDLSPRQFTDILALMGDKSDNVPGVPGIGKKTAPKLIRAYESVEQLVDQADKVDNTRARKGLVDNKDEALLSKKLVTIRTDVDLDIDWHNLKRTQPQFARLRVLFGELEFDSLMDRVLEQAEEFGLDPDDLPDKPAVYDDDQFTFDFGPYEPPSTMDLDAVEYRTIVSRGELERLLDLLARTERFAIDTETTSLDPMAAALVGCSVAWEHGKAAYIPLPLPDGTSTEDVLDMLQPVLADSETEKIGQNLKYDYKVLARHGIRMKGPYRDTMLASYVRAPEGSHGLNDMALEHLNYRAQPIDELIGSGADQKSMQDVPVEEVMPYACEDADLPLRLISILEDDLDEQDLLALAQEMEYPLLEVLAEMELAGIRVDTEILEEISRELEEEMNQLEDEIFSLAGEEFNINSPQQLSEILFEKLELEVIETTSTGNPSTKESVLRELSTEHDMPGLVLDWRKLAKLKGTYVDALGEIIHPETGRIHTDFSQTATATGRLSSSNPNLQNIPIRSERGRSIRRAFVADEGYELLSADYAQIELRIIASMSGDEAMKEAFEEAKDIHTQAASRVFGITEEEVTRAQRDRVKQVNYGIPYGISAYGLARRIRIPIEEAQELIAQYHESYPGVSSLLDRLVEQAREKGYVETLLGRRRYIPEINSSNHRRRSYAERIAVNMPVQGTQADMIKRAMVAIHRRLTGSDLESRMLLQVHDELVFEVRDGERERMEEIVRDEMIHALPLDVPVEVEMGHGRTWLDAH